MKFRTIAALGAVALVAATGCASMQETGSQQDQSTDTGALTSSSHHKRHHHQVEMTTSQKNAVELAKSYLETGSFSKKGLIQQLSSSAGEGFPRADARFAVNHIHVNWNAQAVKSARDYLDTGSFSKRGLYEQLSSSAGEGFTPAQARYAVDKVYS
jgi:hypothetical protein